MLYFKALPPGSRTRTRAHASPKLSHGVGLLPTLHLAHPGSASHSACAPIPADVLCHSRRSHIPPHTPGPTPPHHNDALETRCAAMSSPLSACTCPHSSLARCTQAYHPRLPPLLVLRPALVGCACRMQTRRGAACGSQAIPLTIAPHVAHPCAAPPYHLNHPPRPLMLSCSATICRGSQAALLVPLAGLVPARESRRGRERCAEERERGSQREECRGEQSTEQGSQEADEQRAA